MAGTRKPKRVEIGLRLDDMMILREAGRVGRTALVARLRTLKAEMQDKISTVEKIDDALDRLDVAIAKAAAAYGVPDPAAPPTTPGDGPEVQGG